MHKNNCLAASPLFVANSPQSALSDSDVEVIDEKQRAKKRAKKDLEMVTDGWSEFFWWEILIQRKCILQLFCSGLIFKVVIQTICFIHVLATISALPASAFDYVSTYQPLDLVWAMYPCSSGGIAGVSQSDSASRPWPAIVIDPDTKPDQVRLVAVGSAIGWRLAFQSRGHGFDPHKRPCVRDLFLYNVYFQLQLFFLLFYCLWSQGCLHGVITLL